MLTKKQFIALRSKLEMEMWLASLPGILLALFFCLPALTAITTLPQLSPEDQVAATNAAISLLPTDARFLVVVAVSMLSAFLLAMFRLPLWNSLAISKWRNKV